MDMAAYVKEREKHLAERARRIRDFRVFDFNYIPEKPVMRAEVKPVIDALLRYQRTGIANNLLIFGSRGSGKTLMVKYLMHPLRR